MKIEYEFEKKLRRKNSFTTFLYYGGSYYDNANLIEKFNYNALETIQVTYTKLYFKIHYTIV